MEMVQPSAKQLFTLSWWQMAKYKDKNGIIEDGSVRSGKTVWMSISFILWAMSEFDETNFGMAGKTIQSLQRNVTSNLISFFSNRGYYIHEIKNKHIIIISYGGHTNYFYMFGGKDEASQDLVQGITVAGFYFDEVALMPQSFVEQATLRALTYPNRKYWFNCNPRGPYHWFKTDYIDQITEQNLIRLKFSLEDNPILSKDDIAKITNRYHGIFKKRFIDGDWVMAEGIVYSNFDEKSMVINRPHINDMSDFFVSCDYGSQNPTVFELWGKYHDSWILFDLYYYDGRHSQHDKSDKEYANDMDIFLRDYQHVPIVLDPSARSFAIELRQRGYRVIKANNDVIDGIRETQTAMDTHLIYYAKNTSLKPLFREIQSYAWDGKQAEKGIDKVIKKHDHCCDAERYGVMHILAMNRRGHGVHFGNR